MIDLYSYPSANSRRVSILLEELGWPYNNRPVDLDSGANLQPAFLAINPNAKLPAIVDHDTPDGKPALVFESGAILMYLAEKSGKFLPADTAGRGRVYSWLFFQMSGIGPTWREGAHFTRGAPEKIPYAIDRFTKELVRLFGVVDKHLANNEWFVGEYTIADIAIYPLFESTSKLVPPLIAPLDNVKAWMSRVAARPAVARGMQAI